jgi:hypothetical protein
MLGSRWLPFAAIASAVTSAAADEVTDAYVAAAAGVF